MCRLVLAGALLLSFGCVGSIDGTAPSLSSPDAAEAAGPDGGTAPPDAAPPSGIAPAGTVAGAQPLADGAQAVTLSATQSIYRVDADAGEHIAFALAFTGGSGVTLAIDRWTGEEVQALGLTDAGAGVRFLSALDPDSPRTYWVRLHAVTEAQGTLTVTRTPFSEGPICAADCAHLLQMPLPNDPALDGYDVDGGTIFRYWFGRRDLVMLIRYLARQRALEGRKPIFPYDFSQWDGLTPGTDVGAPRHLSHQRGKDVDVSLYGQDGLAIWRSYCTTESVDGGRACIPGTRQNFDGPAVAREIGSAFESGRVTMCFLDRELIPAVEAGADDAVAAGDLDPALRPLFSDGHHLQHWPNHDNHVHIRVSEEAYDALVHFDAPFEAP